MKKILKYITGFSLYIFLSFNFFAQNYPSIFGIENTKWDFPWCNLDQSSITEQITEIDTIIDGVEYKKVGTLNSGGISYDLNVIGSNGYAREDLVEGKVWFKGVVETMSGLDTAEYLIMDLSLNVGDTFIVYQSFGFETITTVDSVYYEFGLKHVRTTHQFWWSEVPLTFIEGLGTNYGISYMHDNYNMCLCLISIKKDSDEVYSNTDCFLPIVGLNDNDSESEFSFFPNPTSSHITIRKNTIENGASYVIYSLLGERIKSETIDSKEHQVDVTDLSKGTYILVLGDQSFKLFITE
jgi:hypothetical protein